MSLAPGSLSLSSFFFIMSFPPCPSLKHTNTQKRIQFEPEQRRKQQMFLRSAVKARHTTPLTNQIYGLKFKVLVIQTSSDLYFTPPHSLLLALFAN